MYRFRNRLCQMGIFRRLVIEHTVRFDMAHHAALRLNNRPQRADLVQRLGVYRFRRQNHRRPPKIIPIRKAGMRADRHAVFQRLAHAGQHGLRITGVKTTGDIGGGDQR